MADGKIVNAEAVWRGPIQINNICVQGSFEVFNSGGSWSFLFGKLLMKAFDAVHYYSKDVVTIGSGGRAATLRNQIGAAEEWREAVDDVVYRLTNARSRETKVGGRLTAMVQPPVRQVPASVSVVQVKQVDQPIVDAAPESSVSVDSPGSTTGFAAPVDDTRKISLTRAWIEEVPDVDAPRLDKVLGPMGEVTQGVGKEDARPAEKEPRWDWKGTAQRRYRRWKARGENILRRKNGTLNGGSSVPPSREVPTTPSVAGHDLVTDVKQVATTESLTPVCIVTEEVQALMSDDYSTEIPENGTERDKNLFTRKDDPFQPARVAEVLRQVKIGEDLTMEQRAAVEKLVAEWADLFALSVSEVFPVENAVHTLDIPADATFSRKIHQKPLTPPQRQYLHARIDEMLAAGVLEQCEPGQVKCVSPTTLAQKVHEGAGLTLEELQHRINDQCVANGFEPHFQMPPRTTPTPNDEVASSEQKWRICQNFGEVNKLTKIAPMPQGDIRTKQQRLSGHRWVSIFDFTAGFYAVEVAEESRPYTAFYVEGRGYFWYAKMPFGLTGAPSTFAHMTAQHLHDLLAQEIMELFVDDGGAAADTFEEMMTKLVTIFGRIRERKLSLSASKSKLFMTTAVFAGATVGPKGVQPDLAKLTAVVN